MVQLGLYCKCVSSSGLFEFVPLCMALFSCFIIIIIILQGRFKRFYVPECMEIMKPSDVRAQMGDYRPKDDSAICLLPRHSRMGIGLCCQYIF